MPCYRCGARQDDPARGASPWKRGVHAGEQVLVCPQCQTRPDWRDDLDHCPVCGRTALIRSLGDTRCRDCGWLSDRPVQGPAVGATTGDSSALAKEVADALARVLGHGPGRGGPADG